MDYKYLIALIQSAAIKIPGADNNHMFEVWNSSFLREGKRTIVKLGIEFAV